MAKSQTKQVKRAEWKGYHKINLTKEQNELFTGNYATNLIAPSDIDILVNNGYKLSISWDSYNSGISASLYCQDKKMEWSGYTLSAWAGDTQTALNLLFFKHYVVAQEQWEIVPHEREGSDTKWG
jgi:hypothetical protein